MGGSRRDRRIDRLSRLVRQPGHARRRDPGLRRGVTPPREPSVLGDLHCRDRSAGVALGIEGGSTMAKGILIAAMNIANAAEDEFHDWYDTEHLPERQRVPGFLACQRWIGAQDSKVSVATYDLDSIGVLQSPGYQAIGGVNLSPWSKRV